MYSGTYQYDCGKLNSKQKKIYDYINRFWIMNNYDVQFPLSLLDINILSKVIQSVIKDHPETFRMNYYRYTISYGVLNVKLHFEFWVDDYKNKRLINKVSSLKKRIISKLPKCFSDKGISKYIWDGELTLSCY